MSECIDPQIIEGFIGQPAVINTWDGFIYSGILDVDPESDSPIILYHAGCCEQTHLDYCDVEQISDPPPCTVSAPACCNVCLPTSVTLFFHDFDGSCAEICEGAGEGVIITLDQISQFGVYRFEQESDPLGCTYLDFAAQLECDEDFRVWTLKLFWGDECHAESDFEVGSCTDMIASFRIDVSFNTPGCTAVCNGGFMVDSMVM